MVAAVSSVHPQGRENRSRQPCLQVQQAMGGKCLSPLAWQYPLPLLTGKASMFFTQPSMAKEDKYGWVWTHGYRTSQILLKRVWILESGSQKLQWGWWKFQMAPSVGCPLMLILLLFKWSKTQEDTTEKWQCSSSAQCVPAKQQRSGNPPSFGFRKMTYYPNCFSQVT